jgi:asparagine synthase (glutamine-hydrolysing)
LFGVYRSEGFSPDDIEHADRSRDTLRHRGPDHGGRRVAGGVYHGFRRLSIIDLSEAGHQPMVAEDGKVAITVNGEIYNFRELRDELAAAGYRFRSQADSEVVLHGYRRWGLDGLCDRLEGMYAAVIEDADRRVIHAIRDRAGMKPFFYFHRGRSFAWASELKALESWLADDLPPVDETAILDFLAFRYIPAPKSFYRDVFKLPPASRLTFNMETGETAVRRYWHLPTEIRAGADATLAEGIREEMQKAVASHMVSDVPVGYLLSGGVDSAVVLTHAVAINPRATAFSIGFEDPDFDESRHAAVVARKLGADHRIRILRKDDLKDVFGHMRHWYDEPFSDKAAVPAFRVSEFARRDVTVVLTGDGGDELFGGYRWYRNYAWVRRMQRYLRFGAPAGRPLSNRRLRLISTRDPVELYPVVRSGKPRWARDRFRAKLGIPADYDELAHVRPWWKPELGPLRSLQYLDFHTNLHNNILTKVDRLSMAVSLEARIPFLSRSMIEYAFSLPESFTFKGGALKGGLKYAYKGLLPDATLTRRKQGFGLPKDWKEVATESMSETGYQEAVLASFARAGKI